MRLATFNILHGRSPVDDRVDLGRFVRAVKSLDADVLALQEVDRNQPRSSGVDLTALAAGELGMPEHRFVAALSGSPGATWMAATGDEHPESAAYGVAVLSRFPVRSWEVVRLAPVPVRAPMRFPDRPGTSWVTDEPRVAVVAVVESPVGVVAVANTHLTFIPWWARRQLRVLRRSLEACQEPLVLMGDFNMDGAAVERHTGMCSVASAATFPADEPEQQLDHVLVDDRFALPITGVQAHRLEISDHRALTVDLG